MTTDTKLTHPAPYSPEDFLADVRAGKAAPIIELLKENGLPSNISTARRWRLKGLQAIKAGHAGAWITTQRAIDIFMAGLLNPNAQ